MLAFLFATFFSLKASAQATTNCTIQARTQAYYASTAGSTYVTEHFAQAFPTGLSVGCSTGRTLRLTAVTAVANFLPSPAGTTEVLNTSYLNPLKPGSGGTNTYGSNFAGQVVALTLSVGFDLADASFSSADVQLKDALITTGLFAGKSVAFVLTQANLALGGCTSQYTVDQLTTIVTAINESSEAGKTGDLLTCTGACSIPVPTIAAPVAYCLGTTSTLLGANVTAATGATINIYTTAAGSTPLPDFQPSTAAISSTTYYISQTIGTCESNRVPVVVSIVPKPNAPTIVSSLLTSTSNIAAWGDSFTDANFGRYPATLSQLSGYNVNNLGVGGQTSTQVKARMLADGPKHTWPSIIWAGRNDQREQLAQTEANIAAMVASLTHNNYLVISVFNGDGEGKGTYAYQQIMKLNSDLAKLYGNHYLDVRSYVVSQYKTGSAQDAVNYTADIPAVSLRSDFLHPNAACSDLIANYIYAHLNQLVTGGVVVQYCQNAQATPLSAAFNAPTTGATLRFYDSATATTPVGSGNSFVPPTANLGASVYYVAQATGSCESSRTPILVNVNDCAAMDRGAAGGSTDPVALEAYPNPFTAQATVELRLPAGQPYELELYNATGNLVKHLADGTATNNQASFLLGSSPLTAGFYLLRLNAGHFSRTLRLTLIK